MTTLWPSRAPSTRGRLSVSPLSELLVFALEHRLHGSFVFETSAGQKSALFIDSGCITKARTADPVEPLGRLLVDASLIDRATLDSGLTRAGLTGHRLGQALVELEAVTPGQLEAMLGEQLARRVSWLGRLPGSSAYGFYADRDFLGDWPICDADPLALIWRSVRDAAEANPRQAALLASLAGRKLRLHPRSAPERLGLSQQEQIVVNALRTRPRELEELLRAALLDGQSLQRLMYALALTHQLDQGQQAQPLDAAANGARTSLPPSAAHRSSRPPPSVSHRTSAPAPPESVRKPSTPPLRSQSSVRVGAASSSRPEVPSERRTGSVGSLHPTDPAVLAGARASFDAALGHVQRQQFEPAEKLARQACERDTGNAEYLALHAWLRAQLGELANPDHASQIVAALDRAALKQRESVSIRFYRGQVLNRLGREEEALRDFHFVLRREPGHVDAERELRLHQMRKRSAEKKPSLLAKLFLR